MTGQRWPITGFEGETLLEAARRYKLPIPGQWSERANERTESSSDTHGAGTRRRATEDAPGNSLDAADAALLLP